MNTTKENAMSNKFAAQINERFPDGSRSIHYFETRREADYAAGLNRGWHPDRTYEVLDMV